MEMIMKKLVIHPDDRSTDFLKPIYEGDDAVVISGGVARPLLMEMVKDAPRVLMMGHGSPAGLFSAGQFQCSLVISSQVADALKKKNNSAFIWCNADRFVARHQLKGFYTGMFVSEVWEAFAMGIPWATRAHVEESNELFADVVKSTDSTEKMYCRARTEYQRIMGGNPVAKYNHERLYLVT